MYMYQKILLAATLGLSTNIAYAQTLKDWCKNEIDQSEKIIDQYIMEYSLKLDDIKTDYNAIVFNKDYVEDLNDIYQHNTGLSCNIQGENLVNWLSEEKTRNDIYALSNENLEKIKKITNHKSSKKIDWSYWEKEANQLTLQESIQCLKAHDINNSSWQYPNTPEAHELYEREIIFFMFEQPLRELMLNQADFKNPLTSQTLPYTPVVMQQDEVFQNYLNYLKGNDCLIDPTFQVPYSSEIIQNPVRCEKDDNYTDIPMFGWKINDELNIQSWGELNPSDYPFTLNSCEDISMPPKLLFGKYYDKNFDNDPNGKMRFGIYLYSVLECSKKAKSIGIDIENAVYSDKFSQLSYSFHYLYLKELEKYKDDHLKFSHLIQPESLNLSSILPNEYKLKMYNRHRELTEICIGIYMDNWRYKDDGGLAPLYQCSKIINDITADKFMFTHPHPEIGEDDLEKGIQSQTFLKGLSTMNCQ